MNDMTCPTVLVKSPAGNVLINESDFDKMVHELAEIVPPPPPPVPALPPVPGPVDPLAGLAADWRKGDTADLKRIAATVSGRAVDNAQQAIDVIEAALKAKA